MGKKIGAIAVAVFMVIGFILFVATGAVKGKVMSEGFLGKALAKQRVYDRMFDDLVNDPAFKPQLEALFGGINVKPDDIKDQIKAIMGVPPCDEDTKKAGNCEKGYLQDLIESSITSFTRFFNGDKLQIDLKITQIVQGIADTMWKYTEAEIDATPVKEIATEQEIEQELIGMLQKMAQGELPEYIPTYPIPEDPQIQQALVALLAQAGQLDPAKGPEHEAAIQQIAVHIASNQLVEAIKVSCKTMMYQLIEQSVLALTDNAYVRRVESEVVLSPPASIQNSLASKLGMVQTAGEIAGWAQVGGIVIVVLGAAGLGFMYRDDKRAAMRWIGTPVFIGGAIMFITWLVAKGMVTTKIESVVNKSKALPESLRKIMTDVAGEVMNGMTPAFYIPSIVAIVIGAGLIGGSFAIKK